MAAHIQLQCTKSGVPATEVGLCRRDGGQTNNRIHFGGWYSYNYNKYSSLSSKSSTKLRLRVSAVDRTAGSGDDSGTANSNPTTNNNTNTNSNSKKKGGVSSASASAAVPNSNYVVPLEKSSCITRPLNEILRDLNKRIPDNIIKTRRDHGGYDSTFLPWYHANRMLSFYAPGWCGEIRDVIFSDNGTVTVVYRVTIRGSDDEAFRESTGTVSSADGRIGDPVAAAEEIAFCRACARFGLGLYLYHEE